MTIFVNDSRCVTLSSTQYSAATIGTSSTCWTYHPTVIESTRRFTKPCRLLSRLAPPLDAILVTVLLKHPHHPVLNPANAAEPVEDAVPEPICATLEYVHITVESDLIAKATRLLP
jgi:hypothetical protein